MCGVSHIAERRTAVRAFLRPRLELRAAVAALLVRKVLRGIDAHCFEFLWGEIACLAGRRLVRLTGVLGIIAAWAAFEPSGDASPPARTACPLRFQRAPVHFSCPRGLCLPDFVRVNVTGL